MVPVHVHVRCTVLDLPDSSRILLLCVCHALCATILNRTAVLRTMVWHSRAPHFKMRVLAKTINQCVTQCPNLPLNHAQPSSKQQPASPTHRSSRLGITAQMLNGNAPRLVALAALWYCTSCLHQAHDQASSTSYTCLVLCSCLHCT